MKERDVLLAAAVLSTLTCLCYWSARVYSQHVRARRDATFAAQPGAYLIRGYEIPFDTGVSCKPGQLHQINRRVLLLMASTKCAVSSTERASWLQLINSGLPSSVGVVLVNVGPDDAFEEIENALAKNHMSVAKCTVTNRTGFGTATGLTATPTTVVLDDEGRVDLAWPRSLTPETQALVRSRLADGSLGALASTARILPLR